METLKIGNENFKIIKVKSDNKKSQLKKEYLNGYSNIHAWYDRPSREKIEIYNYWQEILGFFRITSANTFCYTIMAKYSTIKDNYLLKITKSKNIAYKID